MILCVLTLLCAFTPALLALQTVPSRLLHGRSYKLAAWSSSGSAIPEGDGFFRIKSLIKRMFGGTPASKSLKEPTVVGEVQKKVVIIGKDTFSLYICYFMYDHSSNFDRRRS
jgi:hypothetical protein